MFELYQDAMAIVSKFGKPDLFITFTCNPRWKEIQDNLFPRQTAWDRPDLICRVFKLKLDEFLDDINKKQVFGKVKAAVHVVEFQKRGLPHVHCLIMLENDYKLRTVRQIENAIWAEIPGEKYPVLRERVLRHMIHLPCDSKFRKCVQKRGNRCSKGFPKPFQEKTVLTEDSYPLYRRRRQPAVQTAYGNQKFTVSNRFVVPYNPYLLMKFNAHINVELCNTVTAVKYLYKYLYKGFDRAIVELHGQDEIAKYENCRYVSSIEAFWRMKQNFPMHGRHPVVERLPVHLENQQKVVFKETDSLQKKLDENVHTQLTRWFELNRRREYRKFRKVHYFDIPKYFSWSKSTKQWTKRKKNVLNKNQTRKLSKFDTENKIYEDIVVRTHTISPQDTERFYLRIVLQHRPGATSFTDLRKVNNVVYSSYRRVASKLGLLEDDEIWRSTIQEAITIQTNPFKLRRLFAHMLLHCEINNPPDLWSSFKLNLGDDFKRKNPKITTEQLDHAILNDIQLVLLESNKDLTDYNLPEPSNKIGYSFSGHCKFSTSELENFDQQFERLTTEQKVVYSAVERQLVARQQGTSSNDNLIYIDAPGGTGKTFLLNVIIKGMTKKGFKVLAVAHTGVAAILLENGRTAHSMFRLPLNICEDESPHCDIRKGSELARSMQETDLIIWDEITMSSKLHLECVERSLRDICSEDGHFAMKIVIFAGDFRQILPIVQNGTREEITAQTVKNTEFWPLVKKFQLTKNLRLQAGQEHFAKYLLDVGEDRIAKNEENEIELDPRLIHDGDLNEFITHFYGENMSEMNSACYESTTILAPLNEDVNHLNKKILAKLNSNNEPRTYLSTDTICPEFKTMNVSTELLNSIDQSGLPLHELELKTGAIAFVMRNINPKLGICNGTRILIIELHDNLVVGEITSGKLKNTVVEIPRIALFSDEKQSVRFKRRQFPLRLAFASTFHKIQGQTLTKVGLYLKNNVFAHGILYVGLTRPQKFENIKVFFDQPGRTTTPNIVYHEVFDIEQQIQRQKIEPKHNEEIATQIIAKAVSEIKLEPDSEAPNESQRKPKSQLAIRANVSHEERSSVVIERNPVMIERYGITIRQSDLKCLAPRTWLGDKIINFYFGLLNAEFADVYCFDTFFYLGLQTHGYPSLSRRTRTLNLLNFRLILMPVHLPGHWVLIAIKPETRRIEYYDSLLNPNDQVLRDIRDYMQTETGETNWIMQNMHDIPDQTNTSDCGVFVCQYGLDLCEEREFSFDQDSMEQIRLQMIVEIKNGQLTK